MVHEPLLPSTNFEFVFSLQCYVLYVPFMPYKYSLILVSSQEPRQYHWSKVIL